MTKEVLDLSKVAVYFSREIEKHKYGNMVSVLRRFHRANNIEVKIDTPGAGHTFFTIHEWNKEQDVLEIMQDVKKILTNTQTPEYYGGEK